MNTKTEKKYVERIKADRGFVDLIMSLNHAETEAMLVFAQAIKRGVPEEEARQKGLAVYNEVRERDAELAGA